MYCIILYCIVLYCKCSLNVGKAQFRWPLGPSDGQVSAVMPREGGLARACPPSLASERERQEYLHGRWRAGRCRGAQGAGMQRELVGALACRGGDRNSQQIPSLGRTTREKARQTRDRSQQDTDPGSQPGQVVAPDGGKRRRGTGSDHTCIQSERFPSSPE